MSGHESNTKVLPFHHIVFSILECPPLPTYWAFTYAYYIFSEAMKYCFGGKVRRLNLSKGDNQYY